jgi:hypothetical protein
VTIVQEGATATVQWTLSAGRTVVLNVTAPDGTTSAPPVTPDGAVYSSTFTTVLPGQYRLAWEATDAAPAALADVLNVWPSDPRYLISLDDARRFAGSGHAPAMTADQDSLLQLFNAAATVIIEDIVGAVLLQSVTQDEDGGKTGIALWQRPATGTAIVLTVNGVTWLEGTDFTVDRNAGIIYAGGSTAPLHFPLGRQNIHVGYTTGGAPITPNILQAAGELVKHQWQVGYQAVHAEWTSDPSGDDALPDEATPSGFLIPRRVMQLCRPTPRLAGF